MRDHDADEVWLAKHFGGIHPMDNWQRDPAQMLWFGMALGMALTLIAGTVWLWWVF